MFPFALFDITALRSAIGRLTSDNAQQELYLTDVISILRRDGRTVHVALRRSGTTGPPDASSIRCGHWSFVTPSGPSLPGLRRQVLPPKRPCPRARELARRNAMTPRPG